MSLFPLANCADRRPQWLHAVCAPTWAAFLDLHGAVFIDAEIDRIAEDRHKDHRHGGEFERRRSAVVADEGEAQARRRRPFAFASIDELPLPWPCG